MRAGDPPIISENERAYRRLKGDILALRLKPGEALNEAALCAEFGIGRTPVNKALHRLMHEGLVRILPRKGVLVQPLSMDEFAQLVEVRRLTEPACAARAAERIGAADLARLDAVLAEAPAAPSPDLDPIIEADRRFHAAIAAASGNRVLAEVLDGLHGRSVRFWALSLGTGQHLAEVAVEHAAIRDALARRSPSDAAAAMTAHIESFARTLAARLG
ncbi:transcriptional regulator, GntR family [Methylobacterium sp. 4-46]|uniref:GntR family transcriptional regulator n=1 Tax=unclassified Methylobacterium TaxID=2615210 RepID=UPI000152D263|nr:MULTISPECIES: GntR family transcriptional regulator [Methylobacterium]ACA19364.1 transcriptional regulator, GntR family [Methylobacterium sp. 4-46]WFT78563.1 GntR family transcriptional regulator [Methylobacterium nodulans]